MIFYEKYKNINKHRIFVRLCRKHWVFKKNIVPLVFLPFSYVFRAFSARFPRVFRAFSYLLAFVCIPIAMKSYFLEISCFFIDFFWFSLIFIDFQWFQWFSMIFIDFQWFSLICIDFIDFHYFGIDLHWFSLISLFSTVFSFFCMKCYRVNGFPLIARASMLSQRFITLVNGLNCYGSWDLCWVKQKVKAITYLIGVPCATPIGLRST